MNKKDFQHQYELSQVTGKPTSGSSWERWPTNPPYISPSLPGWPATLPNTPRIPPETEEAIKKQVEEWNKLQEEKNKQSNKIIPNAMEEANKVQPGTAIKLDTNKLRWSLLPYDSLEEVVKVLEFGAVKYAPDNWKQGKGLGTLRVLNSCLRHLFSYLKGEKVDPETGLSHLAHATCNLLFALHYIKHKDIYLQDGVVEKNT